MRTIIKNAVIVNEGKQQQASLMIEDNLIADIIPAQQQQPEAADAKIIDASGCYVLPGIIDDHVHFREPGLTDKADMESESRAAAAGGVTTCFDMPNTMPQTTTIEALHEKQAIAASKCHINHAFFFGATNSNAHLFEQIDPRTVPGIKLFMGSSTGNMLVDNNEQLMHIFSNTTMPIMAHCEDTAIINRNMAEAKALYGNQIDIAQHPLIRSEEACYESSRLAVQLAKESGAHLHIAHVTTAKELEFFGKDENITGEAVVAHLMFSDKDYAVKGARIKCNPAVKTAADREALRKALSNGKITVVGTDHAPHQLKDKQGGCAKAASGMPMVQFSLVSMLKLVDEKVISIERLVELMCHNPARLFHISQRGFLRPGYKADVVVVRKGEPWKVTAEVIQSKCKWSPVEGDEFAWKVEQTFCTGRLIYDKGVFDAACRGEELEFRNNS